ncbi:hypothetical protein [Bradyrhizobium sp. SZCCHNRI2049]|uniref:hypothetical protein n=1 Tax=Bradyrhizobium sp. SZCCHNRI2049 TaxID=3057287 RepID=UPI0029167432|nr:hypothetical protein [Bradyrhizobium sp. SZCCHNRI2049]
MFGIGLPVEAALGEVHGADQLPEARELLAVDVVTQRKRMDRGPGNRAGFETCGAVRAQLAERLPLEQQMGRRFDAGDDAGQLIERAPGALGRGDDLVETLTPLQLPEQGLGQFFASASVSAF